MKKITLLVIILFFFLLNFYCTGLFEVVPKFWTME